MIYARAAGLFATTDLGCVRLTVFRNRNTGNISYKSFVFTETHIKIVEYLLKCYFQHIFIILAALKRAKHVFLFRNRVNRTRPYIHTLSHSLTQPGDIVCSALIKCTTHYKVHYHKNASLFIRDSSKLNEIFRTRMITCLY